MKLKTYSYVKYYYGFEIYVSVCTNSYKRASEILDVTVGFLKSYAYCTDDTKLTPHEVFARPGIGGVIIYMNLSKEYIPLCEMVNILKECRLECPTYDDVVKKYKM